MMKRLLSALFVVLLIGFGSATTTLSEYSVVLENGQPTVISGFAANAQCWGDFNNTINTQGWHFLRIQGNPDVGTDADMAYACGYLEGYVTQPQIWDHWRNFNASHFWDVSPSQKVFVTNYVNSNWQFMAAQVAANPYNPADSVRSGFWTHIGLVQRQIVGLYDGYTAAAPSDAAIQFVEHLFLQMDEDFNTVCDRAPNMTNPTLFTTITLLPTSQRRAVSNDKYGQGQGHCVGAIRLSNGDGSNGIYAAHTTWASYTAMLRVWKVITLPFHQVPTGSSTVAFSSSPAWTASLDDFYVLGRGMVVMETTLDINNPAIESNLQPDTGCFTWIRVTATNRFAQSPEHWTQVFATSNAGTYGNQWLVMNKVEYGSPMPLPAGTLWMCESVPGLVVSGDVTANLTRDGYFITNDIPFFPAVVNRTGFDSVLRPAATARLLGLQAEPESEYETAERLLKDADDFEDMMKMITYNGYAGDKKCSQDPCDQIAKRCDLDHSIDFQLFGSVDGKVTDVTLLEWDPVYAVIYGGPPNSNDPAYQLPVFTWDSVAWTNKSYERYGIPDRFDFDWVLAPEQLDIYDD